MSNSANSDYYEQSFPKASSALLYDSNKQTLRLVPLSSILRDPRLGKYIQAQEPELTSKLQKKIRLKVDWDHRIPNGFQEEGGVWRNINLSWGQWKRIALGMERAIFVIKKELGMTLAEELQKELKDGPGPERQLRSTQTSMEQVNASVVGRSEEEVPTHDTPNHSRPLDKRITARKIGD